MAAQSIKNERVKVLIAEVYKNSKNVCFKPESDIELYIFLRSPTLHTGSGRGKRPSKEPLEGFLQAKSINVIMSNTKAQPNVLFIA